MFSIVLSIVCIREMETSELLMHQIDKQRREKDSGINNSSYNPYTAELPKGEKNALQESCITLTATG